MNSPHYFKAPDQLENLLSIKPPLLPERQSYSRDLVYNGGRQRTIAWVGHQRGKQTYQASTIETRILAGSAPKGLFST
jgi:hypothetical protein